MNLANALKDRVTIQLRVATQTAMGETVVWVPVETRHARVVPLDAAARAVYMQMQSQVTHKILFNKGVSISLGNNRILHGDNTYEPVEPTQEIANCTTVICKEV